MKRSFTFLVAACCSCLWASGCRTKEPTKTETSPPAGAVGDRPVVLATLPAEGAPTGEAAPPTSGLGLHASTTAAGHQFVFGERGGGVAYVVEDGERSHVVHNGRAGKRYAAVGEVALSPDGRRSAHGALVDGKWRMVVDGAEGEPFSAVQAPVFSPNGAHVAYQAMAGERWHLVVDGTVNAGTPTRYVQHEFSGDSSALAFIEAAGDGDWGRLVVSDLAFRRQTVIDEAVTSTAASADRTMLLAITMSDGPQALLMFRPNRPDRVTRGPSYDAVFRPTFGPDGASMAYLAWRDGRRFMVLGDKEEPFPGGDMVGLPAIRPDGAAVAALITEDGGVSLREFFVGDRQAGAAYEEAEGLVFGGNGLLAHAARKGERWFVVVDGKEGPPFDRVVSPAFSPDGRHLVYRARQDGRRFVVVADATGRTVRRHQAYDQVFPVRFTSDGKSTAYGVKDGRQLAWKVEPL